MYPRNLQPFAAIGFTGPAGHAVATVKVGHNGHGFADGKGCVAVNSNQFARQFVAQYARLAEIRLRTIESMQISATDAHTPDADQSLSGL